MGQQVGAQGRGDGGQHGGRDAGPHRRGPVALPQRVGEDAQAVIDVALGGLHVQRVGLVEGDGPLRVEGGPELAAARGRGQGRVKLGDRRVRGHHVVHALPARGRPLRRLGGGVFEEGREYAGRPAQEAPVFGFVERQPGPDVRPQLPHRGLGVGREVGDDPLVRPAPVPGLQGLGQVEMVERDQDVDARVGVGLEPGLVVRDRRRVGRLGPVAVRIEAGPGQGSAVVLDAQLLDDGQVFLPPVVPVDGGALAGGGSERGRGEGGGRRG